MILEIVSKICGVFLITGAGFAAVRCKLIPEDSGGVLTKVLFNIVIPASIFTSMQGQSFQGQLVSDTIWSFASYSLATVLIGLLSFPLARTFRVSEQDQGIYRMQLTFSNVGFMGIPLVTVVFGQRAGLLILLMNLAFTVLMYSFGVFLVLYEKGKGGLDKSLLKQMVNIPMVASVIGVVILVTGARLPEVVNGALEPLADMMVPVGMLLVGIQLGRTEHKGMFSARSLWLCVLSLVVTPLLSMGLCALLPQSDAVSATLVYAMAMPAGAMCSILAEQFGRNTRLASETLALCTFFSLLTLPVWAVVLTRFYGL